MLPTQNAEQLLPCTPRQPTLQLHWTAQLSNVQAAGAVDDLMQRLAASWQVQPAAPPEAEADAPLSDAQLAALLQATTMPADTGLRRQLKAFLRRQRARQWAVLRVRVTGCSSPRLSRR